MTELYIKNMVCQCCVRVVKMELESLGYNPLYIDLGMVRVKEDLSEEAKSRFAERLRKCGLDILVTKKSYTVERIKSIVNARIYQAENFSNKPDWYHLILDQLNEDFSYDYLSKLFSSMAGITLEHYIISQKIERVKELIFQNELNLREISEKMGFANQPHLSYQFKLLTGVTPSKFREGRVKE